MSGEAGSQLVTVGRIKVFFIEFDGAQVRCCTDAAEVGSFISKMFDAMLVSHGERQIGYVELLQSGPGFSLNGGKPFEVRGDLSGVFDQLRHEILMTFILYRRDLLWLHAGVVRRGPRAVLIAGASGEGKSTLVTLLCERGWRFLSDDCAPLAASTREVLAYPQTPRRRIHPGREVLPADQNRLERELCPVPIDTVCTDASPVGNIVFLEFAFGVTTDVRRLTPGETTLGLIRNCTNFVDHKESAVAFFTSLARSVPGYALRYGDAAAAANAVEELAP